MFKGTTEHVLTYFKCLDGKDASEGEAGFATLMGTQSLAMNAKFSGSKAVNGFCFFNTSSRARAQKVLASHS
jgi:hypothetical protein